MPLVVLRKREARWVDTEPRRVFAFAFDWKPLRALGRLREGEKSDV